MCYDYRHALECNLQGAREKTQGFVHTSQLFINWMTSSAPSEDFFLRVRYVYLALAGVCRVVGKVSADSTFYSRVEVGREKLKCLLTSPTLCTSSKGPACIFDKAKERT